MQLATYAIVIKPLYTISPLTPFAFGSFEFAFCFNFADVCHTRRFKHWPKQCHDIWLARRSDLVEFYTQERANEVKAFNKVWLFLTLEFGSYNCLAGLCKSQGVRMSKQCVVAF